MSRASSSRRWSALAPRNGAHLSIASSGCNFHVEHDTLDGRLGGPDSGEDLVAQPPGIGEEERRIEAIDEESWRGLRVGVVGHVTVGIGARDAPQRTDHGRPVARWCRSGCPRRWTGSRRHQRGIAERGAWTGRGRIVDGSSQTSSDTRCGPSHGGTAFLSAAGSRGGAMGSLGGLASADQ